MERASGVVGLGMVRATMMTSSQGGGTHEWVTVTITVREVMVG